MSKINVMAEKEYEKQFTDILLLLVSVECFVAFEFASNVRKFFVDALDFCFFTFTYNNNVNDYFQWFGEDDSVIAFCLLCDALGTESDKSERI